MTSQKESSTECNPFYVSKADLEALDFIQHNLNGAVESSMGSLSNSLSHDILYLKDMVRLLSLELHDLKREVEQKSVVFDESCDERYAEDWRET